MRQGSRQNSHQALMSQCGLQTNNQCDQLHISRRPWYTLPGLFLRYLPAYGSGSILRMIDSFLTDWLAAFEATNAVMPNVVRQTSYR